MRATDKSRSLTPMTERFRVDGAPYVPLSPTKGLKNATIIYQAIRSAPGKTLLRGDFDHAGMPVVYFPEVQTKCIGKLAKPSLIKARNLEADRTDMANFLMSIADAALALDSPDQRALCAAAIIKKKISEISSSKKDFHASELIEPLRSLSRSYNRVERQKIISQYRQLQKHTSKIHAQRINQFCTIKSDVASQLSEALKRDSAPRFDVNAKWAVLEMRRFLQAYLNAKTGQQLSFQAYLRSVVISPGVCFFAKRWIAISTPKHTVPRMLFDTDSWSREIDAICPLIVTAYRRQTRIGYPEGEDQRPDEVDLAALPPLPPLPPLPLAPQHQSDSVILSAVPKTSILPAISIYESAYPVEESNAQLSAADPEAKAGAMQAGSSRGPVEGPGRQSSGLSTSGVLSTSDSMLISEMQALLGGSTYQPIPTPDDVGIKPSNRSGKQPVATLYQLPKISLGAASEHGSTSTTVNSGSMFSEVPSVSSTEVDPSTDLTSIEAPGLKPASTLKLELELSEDAASTDERS